MIAAGRAVTYILTPNVCHHEYAWTLNVRQTTIMHSTKYLNSTSSNMVKTYGCQYKVKASGLSDQLRDVQVLLA
jgi:hypothetical protein